MTMPADILTSTATVLTTDFNFKLFFSIRYYWFLVRHAPDQDDICFQNDKIPRNLAALDVLVTVSSVLVVIDPSTRLVQSYC